MTWNLQEDNNENNVGREKKQGKPGQRWEKDITDTFGTMAAASRVAQDMIIDFAKTSGQRKRKGNLFIDTHFLPIIQLEMLACKNDIISATFKTS